MTVKYVDASATFGPRDAVADRLVEVRAKQPRKHFAHTPELEWSTGGPQGDTPATLRRPAPQEYAAPVVPAPQMPHHHDRGVAVYQHTLRQPETKKDVCIPISQPTRASSGHRNVGDRLAALEAERTADKARIAALEAQIAGDNGKQPQPKSNASRATADA